VGKTDLVREIADETGRKLIILILSQMEPGDLIGLPARDEGKTVFLKPDWWPESDETIVLLDEINRAHRSIRNAIMQLLIDRRIHNHILPSGTWLIAAMNPPDDEYDQAELITDPAFISRFFILEVNPDPDEWIEWAEKEGVHESVREFIRNYPEFLSSSRSVSLRAELKPSPRSWYKLGKVLSVLDDEELERYGYTLAAGILGPEAAKAFYDSFMKKRRIPSAEKILLNGFKGMLKDVDDYNTLVVRVIDYLSSIDDEKVHDLEKKVDEIASNLADISRKLPKESFYALMRYIVDESGKGGIRGKFFDDLLSRLTEVKEIIELVRNI
jgi:MoxR-like ATPase